MTQENEVNKAEVGQEIRSSAKLDELFEAGATASRESNYLLDSFRVHIPTFDGPLDLLLHLIRKDQLNIYDIPIAQVCKSYIEYLDLMKQLDINIASEFMVMAATLIYLKSVMLLPQETVEGEEDPRMPLVQQLLEYERFKKAADELDGRPWAYRELFMRSPIAVQDAMPVESLSDAPIEPVDTFQMLVCLKIALQRTTRPPLQILTDPISIREKAISLGELLETGESIEFAKLLPHEPRKQDIIVSFLAMLELARLKFIEILQSTTFGPIFMKGIRPVRELNQGMLDQY